MHASLHTTLPRSQGCTVCRTYGQPPAMSTGHASVCISAAVIDLAGHLSVSRATDAGAPNSTTVDNQPDLTKFKNI